jgi:hypothetical protein
VANTDTNANADAYAIPNTDTYSGANGYCCANAYSNCHTNPGSDTDT